MASPAVSEIRVDSAEGSFRMWEAAPAGHLAGFARRYCGYAERGSVPVRRREVPYAGVTLIISFGDPIDLLRLPGPGQRPGQPRAYRSFVAGLYDVPVLTEHAGRQHGAEVMLTPFGAYALFGVPPGEYADRSLDLADLGGKAAGELEERLALAPGWPARFALLDAYLAERTARGPRPAPEVAHAWRCLARSGGRVGVAELAAATGWSRRHLTARFREQTGLPPKSMARILRFQRALRELDTSASTLSEVAAECGYYDQAHMNREFRDLAGCTPTEYGRSAFSA